MSLRFHYDIHDDRLVNDLKRWLGLPPESLGDRSFGDLARLRRELSDSGWLLEIRETSLETFRCTDAGPRLLIRGERVLLILDGGRRLKLATPDGGTRQVGSDEALADLDPAGWQRICERRRSWKELGISHRRSAEAERLLGPVRSDLVSRWFLRHPAGEARSFLELVSRHPGMAPFELDKDLELAEPWLEIRLSTAARFAPDRSPWRTALELAAREKALLVTTLVLATIGMPLGFALSMTTAALIDYSPTALTPPNLLFGLILVLFAANRTLHVLQQYVSIRLNGRLSWRLARSFLHRVLGARIDCVRRLGDGDLYTRLNDLNTIQGVLTNQALSFLFGATTLVGGVIFLARIAPFVLVPTIGAAALICLFLAYYVPRLRALRWSQLRATSRYRDCALERMEGRRLFKQIDVAGRLFLRIDPHLTRMAEFNQQAAVLAASLAAFIFVIGVLQMGFVTWLAALRFQDGAASLGALVVVIGFAAGSLQSILQLIELVPSIVAIEPSVRRVQEVTLVTTPEPPAVPVAARRSHQVSLRVEDLRFSWDKNTPILQGVDFELSAGSWTCLLGPSGSGKSTLATALAGLIEPDCGTIVLDGRVLSTYSPTVLRHRIALITQEPYLFNRTIRENLTLGRVHCRDEELAAVLNTTGLSEFVSRQPRGWDQLVGDNGARMSLGEKCRLSLARGLLRRPGLVILDESLSRLDIYTRERVIERLRARGVTVLFITHDLSQARHCEQLLLMREGRIEREGTVDEMIESGEWHPGIRIGRQLAAGTHQ